MSYEVYRLTKAIETELEDKNSQGEYKNEMIFRNFVSCFNIIVNAKKYNPKTTPYFDLKLNWAFLKKQCFYTVLTNVENWLAEAHPEGYD